ncbi:NKG2-A/NKG2-B type II integral membrane protein-like [Erinaceus europaeus]|uniref:NKG2-A/NKG2-B type II integral membrane protein-like n=1 Tax=Erinaceus europaeus TaxID=9365 RepID=A0A1S2Z9C0_ERIEU|nr:NKG2-A/NKG2-B type II integral membrane protein-like [Erinaceus europaeus]
MDNQKVIYTELKLIKDSKRQQTKSKSPKELISLTGQEITYAELTLQNVSQERQRNDKHCHCKGLISPPEKLLALILLIACLALISAVVSVIAVIPYHYDCCPKEWVSYSNHCYYFSYKKESFNESRSACVFKNSSLLYIDNEEEMTFLQSLSLVTWIGVSWESSHHPWMSINGSEFKGQIDHRSRDEANCAAFESLLRTDDCRSKKMYICKHKLAQQSS